MTDENKKRINKLIIPFARRTLSLLTATTILATGAVGCREKEQKDKNKDNSSITSSVSDEAITSSDNQFTIDDNSSITNNESSKNEQTNNNEVSNNVISNNKNNSTNNTSSNKNNQSSNSNSSINQNNSSSVNTPSVSTPTQTPSTPTMPTQLTAENINDVEVFKHFAKMFRKELEGNLIRFDDKVTDGVKEFQLMLALMNYKYINDDTLYQVFHDLSQSELQTLSEFISGIVTTTVYQKQQYNYNKYFIDKKLGNFMMEVQNNIITQNQVELKNSFDKFYFDSDNPVKYDDNFWVDYNIYLTVALTIYPEYDDDDILVQKNISARVSREVYNDKIVEIYKKKSIKVKIKE